MSMFSDNLRYLRINEKKSQQDIAEALGIMRDIYSNRKVKPIHHWMCQEKYLHIITEY
jgi:transcriptional regulator with XRE-family HTH domain